ncbi:MAG TPA: YcxB family protein, partial [Polyangiaceae bacterium]|nr:YcxB family protein [Polyangiaceae bacterium]
MADVVEAAGEHDPGQAEIRGELDLIEADLVRAAENLPEFKRRWLLPLAGFGVVSFTVLLNRALGVSWRPLLPIALMGAFFCYFQHSIAKKWPARALAELGAGKTKFRFDGQGVSVESPLRQLRYAWPGLARQLELPDSFIIYPTPRSLFVVPKRAFDEAELPLIRELLQTRVVQKPGSGGGALKRVVLVWLAAVVAFTVIWHFLNEGTPEPKGAAPSQA